MMQNVKYAIAWLWGLAFMGSIWALSSITGKPEGWLLLLVVLSFVTLLTSSIGLVWIVLYQLIHHWEDE